MNNLGEVLGAVVGKGMGFFDWAIAFITKYAIYFVGALILVALSKFLKIKIAI